MYENIRIYLLLTMVDAKCAGHIRQMIEEASSSNNYPNMNERSGKSRK